MKELDEATCRSFLRSRRFGTLALADGGEAYCVPLFYAFDGESVFFISRPGAKDGFREHTKHGCFVVVEFVGDDDWTSVQVRGPVRKVDSNADAERAFAALADNPFPPEFGMDTHGQPLRSGKGAYLWMMDPEHVSGRHSSTPVRLKR